MKFRFPTSRGRGTLERNGKLYNKVTLDLHSFLMATTGVSSTDCMGLELARQSLLAFG